MGRCILAGRVASRFRWFPGLRQGLALILVPSLVLVGLELFQVLRVTPQLTQSQDLVAHTLDVISTIRSLERATQDAERGQRGYLITGEESYLAPYDAGVAAIATLFPKLKELTAADPEQQRRWAVLEQQINIKLRELSRSIDARRSQGFDAARAIVMTDIGADAMRALDQIIDEAEAAEETRLKDREAGTNEVVATATFVNLIGAAISLLIIVVGVFVVSGDFRRLARSERALQLEMAERERTEGILRQAQKMDVLGQLTGGIAHDFNNMLGVIVGSLDLLKRRLRTENPRLLDPIRSGMQAAERSAALVQRLLAFSRQQPLDPKPIDANRLVGGMSGVINRTLGENIAIQTVLAAGLWTITADVNQLENALLNLAVNARDAMPEGGKLTIETANTYLDEAYARSHAEVSPGQYVMIAVTDTGIGMSDATIDKAFEPFFTTKEPGQGTGLGLSQVYGFVKQSAGHVKIYSELGQGTTVKLYLPRTGDHVADALDESGGDVPAALSRSETILVVEDNDLLAASVAGMLREQGYRVLTAPNGASALHLLDMEPPVDLLFTDVGLPGGMNGRQLADEARKRRPDLLVLFTTGYTRNAIIHQGRLDPGVEFIGKPFTTNALIGKVQRLLDAQNSNRPMA